MSKLYLNPVPVKETTKVKVTGEFFDGRDWLFAGEYEFPKATTLGEIGLRVHRLVEEAMKKNFLPGNTRFAKLHAI